MGPGAGTQIIRLGNKLSHLISPIILFSFLNQAGDPSGSNTLIVHFVLGTSLSYFNLVSNSVSN